MTEEGTSIIIEYEGKPIGAIRDIVIDPLKYPSLDVVDPLKQLTPLRKPCQVPGLCEITGNIHRLRFDKDSMKDVFFKGCFNPSYQHHPVDFVITDEFEDRKVSTTIRDIWFTAPGIVYRAEELIVVEGNITWKAEVMISQLEG